MDTVRFALPFRSPFYAPVYLAISQGMAAGQDLDIRLTYAPPGGDPLEVLMSGMSDVAVGGPIRLMRCGAAATGIQVFGQVTGATAFVVLTRDLVPGDWRSLIGRRYLPFAGSRTPLVFTCAHLARLGIDAAAVEWLHVDDMEAAVARFTAGGADLIEVPEPVAARLIEAGAREFAAMARVLGPMPFSVVMARRPANAPAADRLGRLMTAIARSQAWMHGAGPVEVAAALAAHFPEETAPRLLATATRYLGDGAWARAPGITAPDLARLVSAMAGGGEALPALDPESVLAQLQG